jgi:hypothetical protein
LRYEGELRSSGEPRRVFLFLGRRDGRVVKLRDDLLSATRYALMSLRFAEVMSDKRFDRRLDYSPLGTAI